MVLLRVRIAEKTESHKKVAESSIAKAARVAREKRKAREAAEKAAAKKPEEKKEPEKAEGFFASFFNRADTIDSAVDAATGTNQERDAKDKQ